MGEMIANTLLVMRKELGAYFNSAMAYIFLIAFLLGSSLNFLYQGFFEINQASMRIYFEWMPWVFLVLVPALTMRIWSEERREGTIELLMTLPLRPGEVLVGKFVAAWLFLSLGLVLSLPIPIVVSLVGDLDWGPVFGGYMGSVLLGGVFLAIGMFVSSLSGNQILSFLLAVVFCLGFLVIGSDPVLNGAPDWLLTIGRTFGFAPHFANISRGVIDSRDLVYFGSLTFFFLVVNRYVVGSYRYA